MKSEKTLALEFFGNLDVVFVPAHRVIISYGFSAVRGVFGWQHDEKEFVSAVNGMDHFELVKHCHDSLTSKALRYMFINIPTGE